MLELAEFRDDINIFRLTKTPGKSTTFEIRACNQDREPLRELGVNPASVYLANCTIWVEGITDRLYIQAFLERYKQNHPGKYDKYIENYHYIFVEYQGANLEHWHFSEAGDSSPSIAEKIPAKRTTSDILVIADNDIKGKGDRHKNLTEWLPADKIYTTSGKETENLLPENIVKKTVKTLFKEMRPKNKSQIHIDLIDGFTGHNSSETGIGRLIDNHLKINTEDNPNGLFSDESGTIKSKVKFCKTATNIMSEQDWEPTEEINTLCKKIMDHIALNNDRI